MPAMTVWEDGVMPSEKSVTCKVTLVECARLPLVPVMVSVELAAGVEPEVVTVMVEDPGAVSDDGLKLAPAPVGRPPPVSEMLPGERETSTYTFAIFALLDIALAQLKDPKLRGPTDGGPAARQAATNSRSVMATRPGAVEYLIRSE